MIINYNFKIVTLGHMVLSIVKNRLESCKGYERLGSKHKFVNQLKMFITLNLGVGKCVKSAIRSKIVVTQF